MGDALDDLARAIVKRGGADEVFSTIRNQNEVIARVANVLERYEKRVTELSVEVEAGGQALKRCVTVLEQFAKRLDALEAKPSPVDPVDPPTTGGLLDRDKVKLPSRLFPDDTIFHLNVRKCPVHPNSDKWINGPSFCLPSYLSEDGETYKYGMKPDTGSIGELYQEGNKPAITLGLPINVYDVELSSSLPLHFGIPTVDEFDDYHTNPARKESYRAESYRQTIVYEPGHRIQNVPQGKNADLSYLVGDRHSLTIERRGGKPEFLCEMYRAWEIDGKLSCVNAAVFWLRKYDLWPKGWTSSNAAGLPFTPFVVRRDEAATGKIDHMLCVTVAMSPRYYTWPASHAAIRLNEKVSAFDVVPFGSIVRYKFNADQVQTKIRNYTLTTQQRAIINALHEFGAVVIDNGMPGWIACEEGVMSGNDANIFQEHVRCEHLEVVDASPAMISETSSQIKPEYVQA